VESISYPHIRPEGGLERLHKLISSLPAHNKHTYLASLLRKLSLKHLSISLGMYQESEWWKEDAVRVSSVAGLIDSLVGGDDDLRALVVEWLIGSQGGGIGEPMGIRRALIVILAKDAVTLKGLFEKSLQQFSNQLWIKHAPILQQEGLFDLSLHLISSSARIGGRGHASSVSICYYYKYIICLFFLFCPIS